MSDEHVDQEPDRPLTLAEAAERLGVHYMTAYRYVRTGRLAAVRGPSGWQVQEDDLASLAPPAGGRRSGPGEPVGSANTVVAVADRLVHGDRPGVVALVERVLLARTDPVAVYLEVLAPAMRLIGDRWEAGQLSVAQEHRATVCAQEVLGQLAGRFVRRGRRRGVVVIGAAPGDTHALPTALLREAMRVRGFEVVDLGANAPADGFVDAVTLFGPVLAVGVCATAPGTETGVRAVVDAVRSSHPGTVVFAGGGAIPDHARAEELALPVFTASPEAVLQLLEDLVGSAARRGPRPTDEPPSLDLDDVVPPR
jgi:excisionase family DNA binding protein